MKSRNQYVHRGAVVGWSKATPLRITCTTGLPWALVSGNSDPQNPPQA